MVSLIRFSFKENTIESISEKIRHFYDIYYLMKTPECIEFVASDEFKIQLNAILEHDKKIFEEPEGWQVKSVFQSPLMVDFTNIKTSKDSIPVAPKPEKTGKSVRIL
jgi:hypothetical protein